MRHRWARRLATTISAVALGLALVLAALLVVPTLLGYERYVIRSGSMGPALPVGSIVFDRVVPVETLRVGDIITFVPPPEFGITFHVTHRIVEIDHPTDNSGRRQTVFRTKGDRNNAADPWRIVFHRPDQAVVAHHIPYVGYAYLYLSMRWVQILLVGVPAILIAILLGFLLWHTAGHAVREEREEREEPEDGGGARKGQHPAHPRHGPKLGVQRPKLGVKRAPVALLVAVATAVVGAGTAWAAFTAEQRNPQTLNSATWVTVPVPTGLVAVQAPRPHVQNQPPQMPMSLTLVNRGTVPVDLTQVTVRYWFTAEPLSLTPECDYFPGGSCAANIISSFVTLPSPLPGADHYYQMGFRTGTLGVGQSLQNIQVRVTNAPDYSHSFNVTNDWSYRGLVDRNPAEDAPCITAYIGGTLVWGQEPSNSPTGACVA